VGPGWQRLAKSVELTRGWGDAYGHILVATGRADVMVDPVLSSWDAAPLLPIVREAGGRFTDLAGNATIHGGSGVSTNGRLHREVLEVLNA
jgi:myo-inositol-1(or 4)-monophosphatase